MSNYYLTYRDDKITAVVKISSLDNRQFTIQNHNPESPRTHKEQLQHKLFFLVNTKWWEDTSKVHPRYGEAIQMVAKEFIIENSQFIIAEDLWRTIITQIILLVDTK